MTILTINDYTDSLKQHINKVQDLPQYTVLLSPSPAQLRNYCLGLCKEDLSPDDKIVLKDFFRGDSTELNDIVKSINRFELGWFKPIQSFLGKKTDTSKNHAVLEIVALMYDYELRPYGKFRRSTLDVVDVQEEHVDSTIVEEKEEIVSEKIRVPPVQPFKETTTPIATPEKKKSKNRLLAIVASIVLMVGGGAVVSNTLSTDKCMKWEDDKYVAYDCGEATIQSFAGTNSEPVPYDKSVVDNFKQITVDCNTVFFKKNKPQVWFAKIGDNRHEYFSSPGTGVHPTLGKPLKAITQYHLNKYIYPKCK
ncbi:hypothetical protein [Myroides sp. N17-2]|uniref:hypothetical protein n=1 Tax=Myroides sp. N17-2 TaxID=2030799 RepID=UPI000EFA6A47|nr:hypothetical protein [Myroides sp. N17-2]